MTEEKKTVDEEIPSPAVPRKAPSKPVQSDDNVGDPGTPAALRRELHRLDEWWRNV